MIEPANLLIFSDRSYYTAHFMDVGVWEPYVRRVCRQHSFNCRKVLPGVPGSFPTFIVKLIGEGTQQSSKSIVVKFFGPLFEGARSSNIELSIGTWINQQSLPISSPAVLAEGQLDADWWYLIFEYIPGLSIGQVRDQLSKDDWEDVAQRMGEYMHQLHAINPTRLPDVADIIQPDWDRYAQFMHHQRLTCIANHQAWNDLPKHLFHQLEDYILPVEQLIDYSAAPHLIHADLTADHLIGRLVNRRWQTSALIDWGDAMIGNILYELVALHIDLFLGDKSLLRHCMQAYELSDFYLQDFPRKALSTDLLFQFPLPTQIYTAHQDAQTLQELAERLFGV